MNPAPATPLIHGSMTPTPKAAVTAASTAFPPRDMTSSAAWTAHGCLAATIVCFAVARSRVMRKVVSVLIVGLLQAVHHSKSRPTLDWQRRAEQTTWGSLAFPQARIQPVAQRVAEDVE